MATGRSVLAVVMLAPVVLTVATANAQTPLEQKPAPPAYTPVRWNENYSYLKDPAHRADRWDALKFISLGPEDWYVSVGGQARYRFESFSNENFGAIRNEWGYALQRYMLHLDAHFGPHLRFFIQGKSALVDDGREPVPPATTIGPRPPDADEADLQQAFLDIRLPLGKDWATLRFGRQELIYGAQRLIGPLDWANVRRTFEGVKISLQFGARHSVDAFLVRPVVVEREECNDGDGNTTFGGVYATLAVPERMLSGNAKIEAFGLGLWRQTRLPAGRDRDDEIYTLGSRLSASPRPFDYDIEAAGQLGKSGDLDVSAFSIAFEGGYTCSDLAFTPRVFLGLDYASGDRDAGDSRLQTFNQLFPTGHLFFGYIDVIGRQNIIDVHPGMELILLQNRRYVKKLTFRVDYHWFCRASGDDGLYNAAGALLRPDSDTDARFVGSELDLLLIWQLDRHTQLYLGYSHFFPGRFIHESDGPDDDIDYAYAAVTFTF